MWCTNCSFFNATFNFHYTTYISFSLFEPDFILVLFNRNLTIFGWSGHCTNSCLHNQKKFHILNSWLLLECCSSLVCSHLFMVQCPSSQPNNPMIRKLNEVIWFITTIITTNKKKKVVINSYSNRTPHKLNQSLISPQSSAGGRVNQLSTQHHVITSKLY